MSNVESGLKSEIGKIFGVKKAKIGEFENLGGSNLVYSFTVEKQKYVIHKLNDTSIMNWKQEKAAYNALQNLNITDELVYYDNGIKIAKFLCNSKTLSYSVSDMVDSLNQIRKVHESGVSTDYNIDVIANMDKYISRCNPNTKELADLNNYRDTIDTIQKMINKLHIQPVLCHGDACLSANFLRLPDGTIKIIDWEQSGMADPLLDIAIAALHQGFENVDPVWSLHHYLNKIPDRQEYFRLFSFLALYSFTFAAWCLYENPEGYEYYLNSAEKYSELVLHYYGSSWITSIRERNPLS